MVEVDIAVPAEWGDGFKDENLTPYEFFQEMAPIFANSFVPFSAIGEHMRAHVIEHGLSQRPRRLLIGGMRASKIFLTNPLLKWYMDHGLEIGRVYQAVEWRSSKCFEKFADAVSDARRLGDEHDDKKVLGSTFKLLGNSSYGEFGFILVFFVSKIY